MGLRGITINDLVLLAVARTLPAFPSLNALFTGDAIQQHKHVHLGIAVDTPRGLMVPVVREADTLSLRQLRPRPNGWRRRVRKARSCPTN